MPEPLNPEAAAALAAAPVVALPVQNKPKAGKAAEGAGGGKARGFRTPKLPEGCPVTPLGTHAGRFFYLDAMGQLRAFLAKDHAHKDLLGLFAPQTGFLYASWPRVSRNGEVTGWRPEACGEALMNACAKKGVWNALERVRGRGAWMDEAGGLVLHVGDAVLIGGAWQPTGLHGGHVYPAAPSLPRPLAESAGPAMMDDLLDVLRSWQWSRPAIDPYLLLGWMGAAILGGALEWRPMAWVTGDKGTGKSTLHRLIRGVMGAGLLATSDASEAGIRQTLGAQTLPVVIDEAEADEDNRRLQLLVRLARQASSGGKIVRGGADHNATDFVARSCFLLSSILIPPLQAQDRSRLAVLDLQPFGAGAVEPRLDPEWMRDTGAVMRRRLIDGWPRFAATLEAYRAAMKAAGHGGRGADQFGTLLACADLLLFDTPPNSETLGEMQAMMAVDRLAETREDVSDSERCLQHLLTSTVTLDGGGRPQTVAYWVGRAAEQLRDASEERTAERALAVLGLRVVERRDGGTWLAVALAHQGLARLYRESHWQARSGASGVWGQSLARLPGATGGATVRINSFPAKCVLLPLAVVREDGEES